MSTVRKQFKTKGDLLKFISQNTLAKANVSLGAMYVEYEDGESIVETPGCVGCSSGQGEQTPAQDGPVATPTESGPKPFDVTTLQNKGAVIDAIQEKAAKAGVNIAPEKLEGFGRADLNAFYNEDANFGL